jgi:hypothetical protein
MWLQENKRKWSDKLTFYGPCHITSAKEGLSPRIPCMQAIFPIQWRHTLTNQRVTRGPHMDWRAHTHPIRLKIKWTPGTYLRTHRIATLRKHAPSGAHRESADPTGRPNWPCGLHLGASTWWLLVGPSLHHGGVCSHSTLALKPINRRRGVHFLETHSATTLSLLVSKSRR